MKTRFKRLSKSTISVLLALMMVISTVAVGVVTTTAAFTDTKDSVGAKSEDTVGAKAAEDNNEVGANISDDGSVGITGTVKFHYWKEGQGATDVDLSEKDSYYDVITTDDSDVRYCFGLKVGDDYYDNSENLNDDDSIGDGRNYLWMNHNTHYGDAYVYLDKNSTYEVCYNQLDDGGGKIQINIRKKVTASTWTAVGDSAAIFGSAWAPTATANDMTLTSGTTTYTWSKKGVSLTAGTYQFKVAQNHSWDYTSYPNDNVQETLSQDGEYDVTVTFNSSSHAVNVTLQLIPKSTLTLHNHEHAVIKAIYNGTSITGGSTGNTISDIPENATINIIVTPDEGYKCTGLTTDPAGATVTATSGTYTLTMPGNNVTVSPAIQTVTMKEVYFNNNPTMYNQVYAYAYSSSEPSRKPLGPLPGTIMTRMPNSNIWVITVPNDCDMITFTGEQGKVEAETIPWNDNTKDPPMYTPGTDTASPSTNGSWGKYIARDNEYIVSKGSTLENKAGLFTGINATFYDYYVDGEIGSTNGGWLKGIQSDEYNMGTSWKDDPYTRLNTELANYATKYGVGVPLYFGNLKTASYTNFQKNPNNSEDVGNNGHNAVTGLTGQTLANSNIHYYKSGATDENGAVMAMFDEDFLSGANNSNTTLATILRSASFPVRNETLDTVYLQPSDGWKSDGAWFAAKFTKSGSDDIWVKMTPDANSTIYAASVPDGYTNVTFYRMISNDTNTLSADNSWNNSGVKDVPASNSASRKCVISSWDAGDWDTYSGTSSHTYYEYDSTGGKDNVFITDISKTAGEKGQAQINYYDAPTMAVKSNSNKEGFFPFDYNNVISGKKFNVTRIYLDKSVQTGWNNNDALLYAYFFGGNDASEAWKEMTIQSGDTYPSCEIPTGATQVLFCRINPNSTAKNMWDRVWNQTTDQTVPSGANSDVLFTVNGKTNDETKYTGTWSNGGINVPDYTGNYYAEAAQYAHDQGFGVKLEIPFTLRENGLNEDGSAQMFEFSGDDDLWVYIDGKLVLDLGGAHARTTGTINFNTKTITNTTTIAMDAGVTRNSSFVIGTEATDVNTPHTMTIYYMERGMFDSNLKFGFSFHAIPNQFKVEKDINTKNINAGFYKVTDDNKSNMTIKTKRDTDDRYITEFEKSYQTQAFEIEHRTGDTPALISGLQYTLTRNNNPKINGAAIAQQTMTSDGTYDLYSDAMAYFVGNFTKNTKFTMKESTNTGQLRYTTDLAVTDEANNSQRLNVTGDNTNGYQFTYAETHPTGIDNLNILATFTNSMKSHTLTLTKALTGTTGDPTTDFTFEILFKFDDAGYKPYPLSCTVNGTDSALSDAGRITIKAGQLIEIPKIPENALVQVKEIFADAENSPYAYTGAIVKTVSGTAVSNTAVTNGDGVYFYLPADDTNIIINNNKGMLTVSHNMYTGSAGDADCFVTVDVQTNEGTSIQNYGQKKGEIVVDSKYIKPGSNYKLVITIDTVPSSNYIVKEFYESIVSMKPLAASGTPSYTAVINKNNKTATITVPISALFDANGQVYKYLPFYSELGMFTYSITYHYTSYRGNYGTQTYKVTGQFSAETMDKMEMGQLPEYNNQNSLVDAYVFKNGSDRTAFLNSIAPYENDWMKKFTWNTTYDGSNKITASYSVESRNYVVDVYSNEPNAAKCDLTFRFPYAVNNNSLEPDPNIAVPTKLQAVIERLQTGIDYNTWYTTNGVKAYPTTEGGTQPDFITAPAKIRNDNTDEYFRYWSVKSSPTDNHYLAVEYTRCYSREFNLVAFQNLIIEPVYTPLANGEAIPNPYSEAKKQAVGATISFIENSRNQWNNDGGGSIKSSRHHQGDRIYTDFLLSVATDDNRYLNQYEAGTYKVGLIIERVAELDKDNDNNYVVSTESVYKEKYDNQLNNDHTAMLKNYIQTSTDGTNSKMDNNQVVILQGDQFDATELDNKNRIEYYYSMSVRSHSGEFVDNGNKNYVYRAYSYLKKTAGNVVEYISTPVYFTIYDMASIANAADGETYDSTIGR